MINIYVIYRSTPEYPGKMVMRCWELVGQPIESPCLKPSEIVGAATTLEELRDLLPPNCQLIGDYRNDLPFQDEDPNIVESWLEP